MLPHLDLQLAGEDDVEFLAGVGGEVDGHVLLGLVVAFPHADQFNFAFDCVDAIAAKYPDKLAMLHLDHNKVERRFTFEDMSRASGRAANYFKALGIKRGDRVMLVLKRHYQFWFAILGLHKLGAVAVPATNQLQEHDFTYRFNAAEISAIVSQCQYLAVT